MLRCVRVQDAVHAACDCAGIAPGKRARHAKTVLGRCRRPVPPAHAAFSYGRTAAASGHSRRTGRVCGGRWQHFHRQSKDSDADDYNAAGPDGAPTYHEYPGFSLWKWHDRPWEYRSPGGFAGPICREPDAAAPTIRAAIAFLMYHDSGLVVPDADAFAGEEMDFVLFPMCHHIPGGDIHTRQFEKLASDLGVPLLLGVSYFSEGTSMDFLLRLDPGRTIPALQIQAHAIQYGTGALEMPDWDPSRMLPVFELGGARAGATVDCDIHLGLLQRHLAMGGARIWLNPSNGYISAEKWSAVLRLRAVENRFFALCSPMQHPRAGRTHPFAFSPDGEELHAKRAGSAKTRPISECTEVDTIYMVNLDMSTVGGRPDWSRLARGAAPDRRRGPKRPVRVSVRDGRLAVHVAGDWRSVNNSRNSCGSGCNSDCSSGGGSGDYYVDTGQGRAYIGTVRGEDVMDPAACMRILYNAHTTDSRPIIWNPWERIPTEPDRLAGLLAGRAIECCAPIVISDETGIVELVELASSHRYPVRRDVESSEAVVDLAHAWGLTSALKDAIGYRRTRDKNMIMDRYWSMR